MKTKLKAIHLRLPENLVNELDYLVEGQQYYSRNQLIHNILAQWIEENHEASRGQQQPLFGKKGPAKKIKTGAKKNEAGNKRKSKQT